jgi:hypothetical protein
MLIKRCDIALVVKIAGLPNEPEGEKGKKGIKC